jgi:DUF4097 and DUF4098 domain-containing protein YvlB
MILVFLGAAFLVNNLNPELRLFTQFAKYWPFLLIGWGVLRLIEILAVAAQGRPLPMRGLSGGEIAIVVLICIIGSTAYSINRHLPNMRFGKWGVETFGQTYDYQVTGQHAVPAKVRVVFDNLRGNVRVTGVDANEVRVTGRKTVRALDKADADRAHQQTPFEIVMEGERLIVRTNHEKVSDNRAITSDLEVTVPRSATVEARGRYGDFDVSDIEGSVEITSDNAGVRLNRIGGNAKVETGRSDIIRAVAVKGSVDVSGKGTDLEIQEVQGQALIKGSYSGNLDFRNIARNFRFESRNTELAVESLPGQINMDLGDLSGTNLVGPVRLRSNSKDVRLEQFTQSLDLEVERGDIELHPKSPAVPRMTVQLKNGNIEVTLPEKAKFELNARTERGDAQNDFGESVKTEQEGRGTRLIAKAGGPPINLTTNRGTIRIAKE